MIPELDNDTRYWRWLNTTSSKILYKGYIPKGMSVQERVWTICKGAEERLNEPGFAEKLYRYVALGYVSFSSPVWSNSNTTRGMPVSCFGSMVDDTMESIMFSHAENGLLMKNGGGTSGYFGRLRPVGAPIGTNSKVPLDVRKKYTKADEGVNGASRGVLHFLEMFEKLIDTVSQGNVRRGFFSPYLDIDHAEFDDFVEIGSDEHPIKTMTTGVCISDDFYRRIEAGDGEAKRRFARVIESRNNVGAPYIINTGNMNGETKPECYKTQWIYDSNMCTEIALPKTDDETFVCVLSSLNLLYWDEWKDTDLVEVMTKFLDSIVTEMLTKIEAMPDTSKVLLQRAYNFAKRHRALGLGVLGWHSYLQHNFLAFDSKEAAQLNYTIFKTIRGKADKASIELGEKFGTVMCTNRRNTTLLAIAPTKTSSFILGQVSQGIEPYTSNYNIEEKAKVKEVFKNPYLDNYLTAIGRNHPMIWESIMLHDGSVQHLDFLSDEAKAVFLTFGEIHHKTILDQAGVRQQFIDQAQSINLAVPDWMTPRQLLDEIYLYAWKIGVKSLYYQYGVNASQALSRKLQQGECTSCHA